MTTGRVQIEVTTRRERVVNMPSLDRMKEILREGQASAPTVREVFEALPTPGMDATVSSSVRITGQRVCAPVMGCALTGGDCPDDQSVIDTCYRC